MRRRRRLGRRQAANYLAISRERRRRLRCSLVALSRAPPPPPFLALCAPSSQDTRGDGQLLPLWTGVAQPLPLGAHAALPFFSSRSGVGTPPTSRIEARASYSSLKRALTAMRLDVEGWCWFDNATDVPLCRCCFVDGYWIFLMSLRMIKGCLKIVFEKRWEIILWATFKNKWKSD